MSSAAVNTYSCPAPQPISAADGEFRKFDGGLKMGVLCQSSTSGSFALMTKEIRYIPTPRGYDQFIRSCFLEKMCFFVLKHSSEKRFVLQSLHAESFSGRTREIRFEPKQIATEGSLVGIHAVTALFFFKSDTLELAHTISLEHFECSRLAMGKGAIAVYADNMHEVYIWETSFKRPQPDFTIKTNRCSRLAVDNPYLVMCEDCGNLSRITVYDYANKVTLFLCDTSSLCTFLNFTDPKLYVADSRIAKIFNVESKQERARLGIKSGIFDLKLVADPDTKKCKAVALTDQAKRLKSKAKKLTASSS